MIFTVTIFLLAIITALGVLSYSNWEVETGSRNGETYPVFKISIRKIEKFVLYYTKHGLQWLVVTGAKVWFMAIVLGKKWLKEKWPNLVKKMKPAPLEPGERPSFVRRAVIESKMKIKRAKENIKEKHRAVPAEEVEKVEELI